MDTEKLIENALSRYAEAVPRPGLEQRVLNRIRKAQTRRRSRGLAAISIGMAAAALLVTVGLRTRPSSTAPIPANIVGLPSAPMKARVALQKPVPKRRRKHLTGEERALLALVERHPAEAQLAFADTQRQPIEPIEITPIEIQPLPGYDPK